MDGFDGSEYLMVPISFSNFSQSIINRGLRGLVWFEFRKRFRRIGMWSEDNSFVTFFKKKILFFPFLWLQCLVYLGFSLHPSDIMWEYQGLPQLCLLFSGELLKVIILIGIFLPSLPNCLTLTISYSWSLSSFKISVSNISIKRFFIITFIVQSSGRLNVWKSVS